MTRFSKLAALTISATLVFPANAATQSTKPAETVSAQPAQAQIPPAEGVVIMVRSTLLALSQANMTNNYSVLNALGSPSFRMNNPPQRLALSFEQFRASRIDIAPVVYVMPVFSATPLVENGKLRVVGLFPTQPMQVNYDLSYEQVAGQWMLSDIAVNLERRVAAR